MALCRETQVREGALVLDFTESIPINATPTRVWAVLVDIERWWPASNPEHESIERLDHAGRVAHEGEPVEIGEGTQFRIRERIAGVPGDGVGVVTDVDPGVAITWEAGRMRYRLHGMSFTIAEGVTWRVDPHGSGASLLSAHVWARFPDGLLGRILWLVFSRLLDGVDKDRHHARVELEYLKNEIETAPSATCC